MHFLRLPFPLFNTILFLCVLQCSLFGQSKFFTASDTLSKERFWGSLGTTAVAYSATVIGLNEIWYKGFERTSFHSFNDWNEWQNMDKAGHAFSAYFFTSFSYHAGRWTGLKKKPALWLGAGLGTLFQSTIEVLDGYSAKWGFSIYDVGFNTIGVALFVSQELIWEEQRFMLKVSNRFPSYSENAIMADNGNTFSSPQQRADELFGTAPTTRFIKDYNGQTIWLSVNPNSFMPDSKIPKWLNISIGYGAENLYGGFANNWTDEDGFTFSLPEDDFERGSQWFLSFDLDLKKLPVKKPFWRFILGGLNVFKIPAPALSFTQNQGWKFHPFYW